MDPQSTTDCLAADAEAIRTALPTDPARRIVTLDILRGVAVLGILIVNIKGWALPVIAMPTPVSFGCDAPVDRWTWMFESVVFEGAMRGLFSLLFGAGFMLFITRLEATGRRACTLHGMRMFWLIVFGLIHGYLLLWPGDILYVYGIAGLALYPLRRLCPRTLIVLSLICMFWLAGIAALQQSHYDALEFGQPPASLIELNREFAPAMQDELDWRRDSYATIFRELVPMTFFIQTWSLVTFDFFDAISFMLLGAALYKANVLTGARSTHWYVRLLIIGYAVGLTVNLLELRRSIASEYLFMEYRGNWLTYDIGRIFMMFGHMAAIILFVKSGALQVLQHALAAVGRMALTNYIMQSIICGLLFYGVGFGLVGRVSRFETMFVVAGIWVVQLVGSSLWLRSFRFGPLEWLWRTLTYRHPAAMRRD